MRKPGIIGLLGLLTCFSVQAQSPELAISAGSFEVFEDSSLELGIEYRFASQESFFNIIPAIGVSANTDGGYWAYAGGRYDINLGEKWILTPQLAVVGYEDGDGQDLGSGFLFRSGIEIGYRVAPGSRLALTLYHMSNANLAKNNPGSESLILSYSFSPFNR
ncbi:acyloxyacyl hydrolase [Methylophaga sp.]|uniref:acyloxyacyl hydrolase n=1 Tax=Methylophaga sp. TaxID=2024840 RepID=UPI002717FB03|nr:acyloxyacyl hydrolase [Methylophaga sp.]MDO8825827.1 acyloxyacyl hydrolase [Methylophaga sp.]